MTKELYIQCVLATLLGNILHVAFKVLALWKDHKVANLEFSFLSYLKDDWLALICDAFSSFLIVYLIDEWLSFNEFIIGKIKTIFVFIGFTGSYVILTLLSVAKKKFRMAVTIRRRLVIGKLGTLKSQRQRNDCLRFHRTY